MTDLTFRQDVFWNNIPIKKNKNSTNMGFLNIDLMRITFIKKLKNPLYVWTGTGKINFLESLCYSEKIQKRLRKSEVHFYLYEPICFRINDHNRSFYSEIADYNPDKKLIVDEFESIKIFTKNNNIKNFKIFTCDYNIGIIQKDYPDLKIYCLDVFLRGVSGNYREYKDLDNKITKKFWCGNWRYTVHRHLVMSYLSSMDGTYSWNMQCSFEQVKENSWFNFENLKTKNTCQYNQLIEGIEYLNTRVFFIDQSLDVLKVDNIQNVFIPGSEGGVRTQDFLKSYENSFCAIVNETRYAQPFGNLSEKTLTAIWARLPFILVAPPYTLQYLKTFGFKTFSDYWDESYDQETNHEQRLLKIFDLIDFINSKSINELKDIYDKMRVTLNHNKKILNKISLNYRPV
jgi:hypothetical protein